MFRFPRTIFAHGQLKDQLIKSVGEMVEAVSALDGGESVEHVAEEMVDTIHALETGLRICQEQYGINIEALHRYVEEKNRRRGYYADC